MMDQPEFISQISQVLKINLINTNYEKTEELNHDCGAEYVHKDQKLPVNFEQKPGEKCVSFDGDADR